MGSPGSRPRIFTLPDCPRCDAVKGWLRVRGIEFEERPFDTDAHVEFIMRNMFGNPPIMEVGSRAVSSEGLFIGEAIDEDKMREALEREEA